MSRTFSNEHCQFPAYAVADIDGEECAIGFKTVTGRKSLNLRKNRKHMTPDDQRILIYRDGEWVGVPEERLDPRDVDFGGLWCATSFGEANGLKRYFQVERRYGPASVLAVLMEKPIMAKPERVKCAKVMSLGEIDEKLDTPQKRREAIIQMANKRGIKIEF